MQHVTDPIQMGFDRSSRVLLIMPHPDDEAVFCGGLISSLVQHNIPTQVLTVTRGEASTLRFGLNKTQDLAQTRDKELARALKALGVSSYQISQIPDGKIETNEKEAICIVTEKVTSYKPTHVITLEPDGIYGHPDHIALSSILKKTVKPPVKLVYATVCPDFKLPHASHMSKKAVIKPLEAEYAFMLSLKNIFSKLRALYMHASQFRNLRYASGAAIFFLRNRMLYNEYFTYKHESGK